MKILMISPECAPFSKVGGLADMVSSLSKQFASRGHDVRIFTPFYSVLKRGDVEFKKALPFMGVHMGLGIEEYCCVWSAPLGEAKCYFVEFNKYFHRPTIYGGDDNAARFSFMCRAALEFCMACSWEPDVIHCHDWTTGFVPLYLNTTLMHTPVGRAATVFTIHNMQHQGVFSPDVLEYAGLPRAEVYRSDNCEHFGSLNLMKGAIYNSTKLSTVSPTYAKEIQTPQYGCGLDGVVRFKAGDLVGIVNGIDPEEWNPATDKYIAKNYSSSDISGKAQCKKDLQRTMGLDEDLSVPIFGVVSRLYEQKGLDMLSQIAQALVNNMKIQIVVLGSGESWLEDSFRQLAQSNPGRIACRIGYDNELSHKIEAGADFFLMPSRFEPCGLNQIYSMIYGTLPIVRATGGLEDTVLGYSALDKSGDGFKFFDATPSALYNTIGWACSVWYDNPADIAMLRQNAMAKDFTWSRSADEYERLYGWAVEQRKGAF